MSTNPLTLPDLPEDVFLLIIRDLQPWDVVRCQKVARRWREAFTHSLYLREVLKEYPQAREVQALLHPHHADAVVDCTTSFNRVASRYYHLSSGKAGSVERYKLQASSEYGDWVPVGQWDYHESQPGGRLYYENAHLARVGSKPYLFRPTLWSYSDGLLVAPFARENDPSHAPEHILSILDVETGKMFDVPFSITRKKIRNISLRDHALVVEWAEASAFHNLNYSEKAHRHFATCYDILPPHTTKSLELEIVFRNEWKMHFLGLPLSERDRFFSTHNSTHYALYIHQPNRSMYTGDEDMPIESLCIWDISSPTSYRPSLDPAGKLQPPESSRPHIISRFPFRELDFLGLRQQSSVALLSISLTPDSTSLVVKENVSEAGQGYFDPAERLMRATTTTFPISAHGPAHKSEYNIDLPPYRGHCSMSTSDLDDQERWFTPIMDVVDAGADVRYSLVETCFTGTTGLINGLVLRVKVRGEWRAFGDEIAREVGGMGRVDGDERWVLGQNGSMELCVVRF